MNTGLDEKIISEGKRRVIWLVKMLSEKKLQSGRKEKRLLSVMVKEKWW